MFPRVTHPSATDVLLRPFDLHVLGLPPAFVLSQDQTLKLQREFVAGRSLFRRHRRRLLSTSPKHTCPRAFAYKLGELKSRDRQSISQPPTAQRSRCQRPARTPPSTFLFLPIQLSNSEDDTSTIVKATPRRPLVMHPQARSARESGTSKAKKAPRSPFAAALQSEPRL